MEKDKEIYIYQVSVSKKSVIVHQSVYVSKGQIPLFMRVCGIFFLNYFDENYCMDHAHDV